MFDFPGNPEGTSRLANWLKKLLFASIASRVRPGIGYRTKYTSSGTFLEIDHFGGSGGGDPTKTKAYRYISMQRDYIICLKPGVISFDPVSPSPEDSVRILKPPLLRFPEVALVRTIHDKTITYTNYDLIKQQRTANEGLTTVVREEQVITDSYTLLDTILAGELDVPVPVPVDDADLGRDSTSSITLYDLNVDGRYWASL